MATNCARKYILALGLILILLSITDSRAQVSDAVGMASLSGLTGFSISVGELNAEAQSGGLTGEQLKSDAAAKLGAAGIAIVPATAWLDSAGSAQLYMEASVLRSGGNQFSFALEVGVIQKVSLQTKAARQTLAVTWSSSSIGAAGAAGAATAIRNEMGALVSRFIEAYRTANPPPKKE